MISASHNPVGDNGIKFFGPTASSSPTTRRPPRGARGGQRPRRPVGTGSAAGCATRPRSPATSSTSSAIADVDLSGCGSSSTAPTVPPPGRPAGLPPARRRGHDDPLPPDGANINEHCGSTYPEVICEAVVEHGADAGISHDGDADRLIAATHEGAEVDGDVILAILARQMHHHGTLADDAVATTVMTNLGFKRAMQGLGIEVVETKVGDRYVLEAMRERGSTSAASSPGTSSTSTTPPPATGSCPRCGCCRSCARPAPRSRSSRPS
jgi:phosphoglucosamine mutase